MTIEASLVSALNGLVSNRVYPDVAPLGCSIPYITYQQVGGEAISFLEKAVPSIKNGRFQVNVWAASRAAANALALQIESALVTASTMQTKPSAAFVSTHDEETNYYGCLQQFSVWSTR